MDVSQRGVTSATFDAAEVGDMDASEVSHLFLREATPLPQGADMGTEGYGVVIHDNLVEEPVAWMLVVT